jgi:hypothetical protein
MGNQASRQRQNSSQAGTAQTGAAPAPPAYAPGSGTPGPQYPPVFRPQVGIRGQIDILWSFGGIRMLDVRVKLATGTGSRMPRMSRPCFLIDSRVTIRAWGILSAASCLCHESAAVLA